VLIKCFKNMFIRLFFPMGNEYLLKGSHIRITTHMRNKGSFILAHNLRDWEIA